MIFSCQIYWRFSKVALLWLPPCKVANLWLQNSWFLILDVSNVTWHQLIIVALVASFFHPSSYTRVKPDICWTQMLIFCGYIALNLPGSSEYSVSYHHQIPLQQKIIEHFESYRVIMDEFHYPDTLMLFSSCYCVATTMQLQICGYRCVILESWCIKCYIKSFVSNSLVPSVSPFLMQGLM